jgi:hypothetical protein
VGFPQQPWGGLGPDFTILTINSIKRSSNTIIILVIIVIIITRTIAVTMTYLILKVLHQYHHET